MKVFSEQMVADTAKELHISNLGTATIGEILLLALGLEKQTGIKFIRMDQGSPGLPPNKIGLEAEKAALDTDVAALYPAAEGIPELKEAASEFIKAFLNIDLSPKGCIPTTGSVSGSFSSFIACCQKEQGKNKILLLNPGFPVMKSQLKIVGIEWEEFDIFKYRGEALKEKIEKYLAKGDIAAILYCSPNNPTWMCLEESELAVIGSLAHKYGCVVIEDLAYFEMDFRSNYGKPYTPPFQPTVARYTDDYILLLSASKIFSYAGQRIAMCCVSDSLFEKKYPAFASRYGGDGHFGNTLIASIMYMITSGCTHTTQLALAAMYRAACSGKLDFVKDMSEYARRAKMMKEIFIRHGFHIVYDKDIDRNISDGFFFSLGYGKMSGKELLKELLYYGVSSISLSITGADAEGVRACSSRITDDQFELLDKRMADFQADHPF